MSFVKVLFICTKLYQRSSATKKDKKTKKKDRMTLTLIVIIQLPEETGQKDITYLMSFELSIIGE